MRKYAQLCVRIKTYITTPFLSSRAIPYLVDDRAYCLRARLGVPSVRALGAAAAAVALVLLFEVAVLARAAPPALGRREWGLATVATYGKYLFIY